MIKISFLGPKLINSWYQTDRIWTFSKQLPWFLADLEIFHRIIDFRGGAVKKKRVEREISDDIGKLCGENSNNWGLLWIEIRREE